MKKTITKYLRYVFIILIAYLFTMCQSNNREIISSTNENRELIEINIDNQDYNNNIYYSDLFENVKLVPLETNENCLIGNIDEIEFLNDTIFLLDKNIAKALYVFSSSGNFIRKIGAIGRGPGEYLSPKSFTIDKSNKQIQILDNNKLLIYSINGDFIKEIVLNNFDSPRSIKSLNGLTYIDHSVTQSRASSFLLSVIDSTGNVVDRWLPNKDYNKGLKQPFGTGHHLVRTPYDIKFIQPLFDTIISINNNAIQPFMALATKNDFTKEDVDEFNSITDVLEISMFYWKSKKFLGVKTYLENENLILFDFQNNGFTHRAFYNLKNKTFVFSKNGFQNDLIPIEGYFPFRTAPNNNFVSVIHNQTDEFEQLKQIVNNDNKILPQDINLVVDELTPNSNPVIAIYKCIDNPKIFSGK